MNLYIGLFVLGLTGSGFVQATVYKCTYDTGNIVFQDEPCLHAEEKKLDLRFADKGPEPVGKLIQGSWCEVGTSVEPDGKLQRDSAITKTWQFNENEMVQYIAQGQFEDMVKYAIRQQPGNFIVDNVSFKSPVNWQVKTLTDQRLIISTSGDYTHLVAGKCDSVMARSN